MRISGVTIWSRRTSRRLDPSVARVDAVGEFISPGYANLVRARYEQLRKFGLDRTSARYIITDMLNAGFNAGARRHSPDVP